MRPTVSTPNVLLVSTESTVDARADELRAYGYLVLIASPEALPALEDLAIAIVDQTIPQLAVIVSRLRRGGVGAVFVRCDGVELPAVEAALAAGARGVVARGTERQLIESRAALVDESLDQWRDQVAPRVVGDGRPLAAALAAARAVADTDTTVLIGGPSGSGKELLARAIHAGSHRRNGPFVAVNTAAIPEHLVESELFGHVRGAFTGANGARQGKLAAASGGTLFLDEIGDMPLPTQASLLRVLQEREVTPVGSDDAVPVDLRVIAATHRDLPRLVAEGRFREDLYYRLDVVSIELPPLRERRVDVLPMAVALLRHHNDSLRRAVTGFSPRAVNALLGHAWPGNGRELSNAVERAVVLRRQGRITAADLGLGRAAACLGAAPAEPAVPVPVPDGEGLTLKAAVDSLERQMIERALERSRGNRAGAAALLGLNRTTLIEKLRKLA